MSAAADSFLLVYAGLFPIVNPIGSAPIFLALTINNSVEVRRGLVLRVAINSFFLLLGSLFVGSYVLVFFGITLPVLRIGGGQGGGVVRLAAAARRRGAGPTHQARLTRTVPIDAFYPLTMPLTVGPGSMSVAIALGAQRPESVADTFQRNLRCSPHRPPPGWRRSRSRCSSAIASPTGWSRCSVRAASM